MGNTDYWSPGLREKYSEAIKNKDWAEASRIMDNQNFINKSKKVIDETVKKMTNKVSPAYWDNSFPKADGKPHHIKNGLAMSKDDDQDYTDNGFSNISWSGTDYWSPFAPYMTWNNEPPKAVSVIKCDCGTSVAMGKDDQLDFHSSWCSLKGNKK